MQHTTSKAAAALEGRVFREWLKLSPERRTGIALRDFEDDLWGRSLRLGTSPFLHHQGVMRVIGRPLDPASADAASSAGADLDLDANEVDTWRELWRRYMSPRWALLLAALGERRRVVRRPKAGFRRRSF
jgi:hypothetical protein